ncbi:MAG: chromosome segregation protein SMC [Clostridia bacterium]|nr:chromosome segregation protein SMC [Clostridia bacterium]
MRLTKLELNGFKSFARKTDIQFGTGVTAVIGPNGSGKSNIADAVRWVLGEQSAKALRGTRMEDVIFSGTQTRKAQSYCEVTLCFDNGDGKLALPFEEVAVTRRVFRSGESEYCINRNPCRLKDVQELFRDTGIGKDGYSIISQGKVDEILANRSNERRAALEEAAGVMRYRVRKEEARRKLENTAKNLERIEDILKELSDRLGPLETQSAAARAYLKLRDELKDCEVNIFLYQYERHHERLRAIEETIGQMRAEQTVGGSAEEALLHECAALEERVRALDATLNEQQSELLSLLAGVEQQAGESRVLTERRDHARQACERIEAERTALSARLSELDATLSDMDEEGAENAALLQLESDIGAAEERLLAADAEVREAEAALERLKNGIIAAMNRLSDYRSSLSRFDAMITALSERLAALDGEAADGAREAEKLEAERAEAARRLEEERAAFGRAEADLGASVETRRSLQAEYLRMQEEMREEEQRLGAAQSRLRVLTEMQKAREGYYASVRSLMKDADRDERLARSVVGVVAELIRVPKEYETAVSMALGSAMQNIVTPTAEDAKYVIDYLRAHDYGRATLLPMALLRPSRLRPEERQHLSMDGCLGVASELIECDGNIRGVLDYLLGRTVIVRDLACGVALKKRAGGSFHIATLLGDIISTGGAMSGGSLRKGGFSLLGREREIQELNASMAGREKALAGMKAACAEKERALLQCDVQIDAFRQALREREITLTRMSEQLDIIRRDAERCEARSAALETERAQLNENLADIRRERAEADSEQVSLEQGNAATREDVIKAQEALNGLRQTREAVSAELTDMKVRRMALSKERDAVLAERGRLEKERKDASARLDALAAEHAANETAAREIGEQLVAMLERISGGRRNADEKKQLQQRTEEERAKLSESLSELRARREELIQSGRDIGERIHRQELQKNRLELELTGLQDHIWNEYELTYENALPFRHEIAIGSTNARIAEIRGQIRELGDINLGAIEDYKSVSERHAALTAQCEDLRKAEADLNMLIVELTDTMQAEFLRQFVKIQENFNAVFQELFGGGHAELRLGDRADVLGCDIDIIAQPPGKKLQLLSLLSGGERALTAIALLFAMLKLKPPAFCVLDEIESSLDEANVGRFADYVKAYSGETQFILITHRKGSMEICDTLYGVSMEEKGVSKIVSARFGEAAS